jgi:hypothetical protein
MSQVVLPNTINYNEQLPSLMAGVNNYTQVLQPVNGSTFTQNQQIFIDIPSRGFIDPKSIYIRYRAVAVTATQGGVIGCPVYTPFIRLDTYINSQMIDTINDYNQVAHVWSNLNLGVNEKYGSQSGFGYSDNVFATTSMDELDGRFLSSGTGETYSVSAPLVACMLTGCEKFIPAFATGGIRLIFTLDANANMFSNTSGASTMTISNFELVYDLVDFGAEVEQSILAMDKVVIKSNSYANSGVALNAGANGNLTLVFNQRFASIRSAVVHPSGSVVDANTVNGKFDAVDVTSGGSYSLNVGGVVFPQGAPINFGTNRSGALMELRKAIGSLYDWSRSPSINSVEFSYTENPTTSLTQPGKVYVGFDLNKINSASNNMLNGTSSQNTPINLQLNIATSTAKAKNINLVLNYDAILTIDPRTKMLSVMQ